MKVCVHLDDGLASVTSVAITHWTPNPSWHGKERRGGKPPVGTYYGKRFHCRLADRKRTLCYFPRERLVIPRPVPGLATYSQSEHQAFSSELGCPTVAQGMAIIGCRSTEYGTGTSQIPSHQQSGGVKGLAAGFWPTHSRHQRQAPKREKIRDRERGRKRKEEFGTG